MKPSTLLLCAAATIGIQTTQAAPVLLGIGSFSGSSDLAGLSGTLENGLSPNTLGGMGSGFTYAGGNTYLALPDRGPNATSYAAGTPVDQTVSYIPRFQTMSMTLTARTSGLAFDVTPQLTNTTLFSSTTPLAYSAGSASLPSGAPSNNDANSFYFSGRSDNFAPGNNSLNANNARLDPEAIRLSNDGKSVFVTDEYGPYVYQFDRATGERTRTFTLPTNLAIAIPNGIGNTEASTNTSGRTNNKGMEGLAITPDGTKLIGIMQANLLQDKKNSVRIVTIDIATGATDEYAYQLTDGSGVSEILAINDHEFLVDERDGKGLTDGTIASVKKLYKINLNGAQSVLGMSGDLSAKAVAKTQFLDIKSALVAAGISAADIPAKIEGMTFGQDVTVNGVLSHTLWIANDNDFLNIITDSLHPTGVANPNQFYVFGVTDADLNNAYLAQQIASVPVPQTITLMLSGLGLLGLWQRKTRRLTKAMAKRCKQFTNSLNPPTLAGTGNIA